MKLCTPEIVWHDKDPIYSVDFHHESGSEWRLASGGTDKHVKVSRAALPCPALSCMYPSPLLCSTRVKPTLRDTSYHSAYHTTGVLPDPLLPSPPLPLARLTDMEALATEWKDKVGVHGSPLATLQACQCSPVLSQRCVRVCACLCCPLYCSASHASPLVLQEQCWLLGATVRQRAATSLVVVGWCCVAAHNAASGATVYLY